MCPIIHQSGRSQVISLNCLRASSSCTNPKRPTGYRRTTSLPSLKDILYLILPGFLHNFCSDNEALILANLDRG